MKFKITRSIKNKLFSTEIAFLEYGGADLTPEEEVELIENFNAPIIDTSKLTMAGKYGVVEGKVAKDDAAGEEVSFILPAMRYVIDNGFVAKYSIDCKHIKDEEVGAVLNDKEKVAEAKCCLFEATIEEAIRGEFAKLKEKRTGLEYLENDEIII